ncbi:MAG: FeoB-associated Cys-rich membrane protein [Oscillospiraceae bacterium]|jgi:hypothetical protein
MNFIIENLATIIISVIVLSLIVLAAVYIYKQKKKGKCVGCDGGSCPGSCKDCSYTKK